MRIPPDMLANTATAFALFALILSSAGIFASLALYATAYMALGSIDATVSPQFDSAELALMDASAALSHAANSSSSASDAIASVSGALLSFSDSSNELSSSLDGIAAIPPFSLDPKLQSAAGYVRQASSQFANASESAAQMSGSAQAAFQSIKSVATDLDNAASKMSEAKRSFRSSLSGMGFTALLFCICLVALFSSVIFTSLSLMLSHYPNLLEQAEAAKNQARPGQKK